LTRSVFTDDYLRFLDLLVAARKRAGLTQAELATALNRPQSYVSKYERRERRIDVVELLDITDALSAARATSFDACGERGRRSVARNVRRASGCFGPDNRERIEVERGPTDAT